jgi:addiction module RelE/StbE family toxin
VKVRWFAAAVDDLEHVHTYISQEALADADGEVQRVLAAVGRLRAHAEKGRPGRVAGTRELRVEPYVVVYRVKAGAVQVLRVLHAACSWPAIP